MKEICSIAAWVLQDIELLALCSFSVSGNVVFFVRLFIADIQAIQQELNSFGIELLDKNNKFFLF